MGSNVWRVLCTIGLLGGSLAGAKYSERRRPDFLAQPLSTVSGEMAGWTSVENPAISPAILKTLRASSYLSRTYQKSGMDMDVFVAYYSQQRAYEEMHSPKHCLPGSGWEIMRTGLATIPVNTDKVTINQYAIQSMGRRAVVFYWYQSKQRIVASEYLGKLLLIKDAALDGKTAASIARIVVNDKPEAIDAGKEVAARLVLELQRCFGR